MDFELNYFLSFLPEYTTLYLYHMLVNQTQDSYRSRLETLELK
jgi:hypothetical protein